MDADVEEALLRAKQRLQEAKPGIQKRQDDAVKNSTEEPDILKSGYKDDLRSKRAEKDDTSLLM
ncbi:hypothetical protein [Marinibactrum halimedae]|uniref:Uncharacterized protein n=1 Tax=Marinibactrum halimedae TaxID=1444977 RepID=A0AA37T6Q4_9GAMM|nr:hypothetical protein [Marinibactrum halimedae]MCD9461005.1 hypothetical protein [Marinibactrum halimedae]GLS27809.1 hypothetical protein GCM10007877_35280 [Marinibactrum halimedae]